MDQIEKNQIRKKLLLIGFISTACLMGLLIRLYFIQIVSSDLYVTEVNRQRSFSIPLNSGRGNIYDRNYIPFTDRQEEGVLLIFTKLFDVNDRNLSLIEDLTGLPHQELTTKLSGTQQYVQLELLNDIDVKNEGEAMPHGVFIFDRRSRYEDFQRLVHVIGYINNSDNKGMTGLERAFNDILLNSYEKNLVAVLDGKKRILPGAGFSTKSVSNGRHLQLTIDYHLQRLAEEALKNQNKNGAVVISNIKTGELLAIASSPVYNPNMIENHINSYGDELYNKALQMTFPPGSIFKILVTAAALEGELVALDEVFYCSGQQEIGNVSIKCSVHSRDEEVAITFENAFAQSCNSTMIQVGQRVGAEAIINMAKAFGLGEKVNIGILEEEGGHLPSGDRILGPAIGNISIGQGEIEVTPLQVNQLTQIIANNGVRKSLYLIDKIIDDNYNIIEELPKPVEETVISREIAETIQYLMKRVMTQGTGKTIEDLASVTAGKTGTAQSTYRGQEVLHGWFTGYYPNDNPTYAVTVFIQQGGSGGRNAVPVFKEVLENMIKLGY